MPEVTGSSSHDGGAVKSAGVFDLHSQKGIANILKQLRSSNLPSETKTTIRELVLRFAQTSGDASVRQELETMLSGVTLAPATKTEVNSNTEKDGKEEEKSEVPAKPVAGFGFSGARPVPNFANQAKKRVIVNESRVEVEPAPQPMLTPAPTPAPKATDTPVQITPAPTPPTPPPAPAPASVPTPEAEPAVAPEVESNNLDRILEIKREVISLVGNPVNLVDIDNAVGKQYMTALLEAMKKTNGGTKAEATAAMVGLEEAFVAVKTVAKRQDKPDFEPSPNQNPAPAPAPQTPPVSTPTPAPFVKESKTPVQESPTPPTPPAPETPKPPTSPTPVAPPTPSVPDGVKVNLVQDEEKWAEAAAEQASPMVASPTVESEEKPGQQLGGVPLQDIPTYGFSKPSRRVDLPPRPPATDVPTEKVTRPATPPSPNPPPPPAPTTESLSHPASKKPAAAASVPASQKEISDDLMTPDITVGLSQLLAEWQIFKGSGLFGMGPGGIDHPLYVNIKDSSMLSIMNGTFSGATSEIQQSINDYVNGWRYEQSIVPQHSETFEHFLRRVVRKVLKDAKR